MTVWISLAIFTVGIGLGWICGLITRGALHDMDEEEPRRVQWCRRCGRLDGSHDPFCEHNTDSRETRSYARARGYAGGDGQDLPRSDGRGSRAANFGTKDRR